MIISPADFRDVPAALAVLFGCEADASTAPIAHAFQMLARGEWNTSDLFVAKANDAIVGAIFAQSLPGSTGVIWPARTVGDNSEVADALTSMALKHVSNVKIVQAFLKADEMRASESLLRAGFRRVTHVMEMHRTGIEMTQCRDVDRLELVPFSKTGPDVFRQALWSSHEKSLDCPELQAFRTQDELFDGYRDCARDLEGWWLAQVDSQPVGVLIIADQELTFVGVVPEHRGRGIGRALVAFACKKSPELSLIVDARNVPAVQLYQSMGFEASGAREVLLKFQKV